MKHIIFGGIMFLLMFGVLPSKTAHAFTQSPSHRFAWLNNTAREFTTEEIQYIATHYDFVVIGHQNDPMLESAKKIKRHNPSIILLVYFPTSIRHDNARYGTSEFKESWYLHDGGGNRIYKTTQIAFIDLTNQEYIQWARATALSFLDKAPYDGIAYDNADPIGLGLTTDRWVNWIGQIKINAWNTAQNQYLTQLHTLLTNRNKIMIYNGIHRASAKVNRTLEYLDITEGTLNERFCYGTDSDNQQRVVSKEYQLEDIDLEKSIGNRSKYVLQKVNWGTDLDTMPAAQQKRWGNYCYGVFLMGHVPGYTVFKFGEGYNLDKEPEEHRRSADAEVLPLGNPTADYHKSGWLLSRRFQNGFVVVNLDTTDATWTAPRALKKFVTESNYQQISQNQQITVAPQTAQYFLFSDSSSSPTPSPTPQAGNPADLVNTGDSPGNQVNQHDADALKTDFGKTGTAGWIPADINDDGRVDVFDYNILVGEFTK